MLKQHADDFRHPRTGRTLKLRVDESHGDVVLSGALTGDGDDFAIVRGIPRFGPADNYAESFGYQWQHFSKTQLDSASAWGSQSAKRLSDHTCWPDRMGDQRILEAGSGMGRFTEHLAATGARVCTFDYSAAVVANYKNNGHHRNVSFAQADIYGPPYQPGSFDKVLCIGVIQHCPSPKKAFMSLTKFVKPGGQIVVDVYRFDWKSLFSGKYYLRPITRRMSHATLHKFVRLHVGWVYPFTGLVQKVLGRPGRSLSWALAMADYRGVYPVNDAMLREHSLLDTFDMLAPAYDRPQTISRVRRWFAEAGLIDVVVKPGWNGIEAQGYRPI
jgi:SAM-dependent methyltransferase